MSSKTVAEKPTINAVVRYAETLRLRADSHHNRVATHQADPHYHPYRPTEAAGRRLYYDQLARIRQRDNDLDNPDPVAQTHEAAQRSLEILATRAREPEREYAEQEETSRRSLERHRRRRREAERDKEAARLQLTIGQRLDRALAQFSVIPAVSAAAIGWNTPGNDVPALSNHGDPGAEAHNTAIRTIREIEALLDRHQLRDLERAA